MLKYAAFAGIGALMLSPGIIIGDFVHFGSGIPRAFSYFAIYYYVLYGLTLGAFTGGFVLLGIKNHSRTLTLIAALLGAGYIFSALLGALLIPSGIVSTLVILTAPLGIAVFFLRSNYGSLAVWTGAAAIAFGITQFVMQIWWPGYGGAADVVFVPFLVLGTLLLFKAERA